MDEQEVSRLLSALPAPTMPPEVEQAVQARLAPERVVVPITARHSRRLSWLVAAAAVLAVMALVGAGGSGHSPVTVASSTPIVRAGAVFDTARFGQQLQSRMLTGEPARPTRTFADTPAGVTACAAAVQAYGKVLFIDVGTYDKSAAVVLVTSYPASAEYEEVWVVSPNCSADQPQVYRHMIYDADGSALKSV